MAVRVVDGASTERPPAEAAARRRFPIKTFIGLGAALAVLIVAVALSRPSAGPAGTTPQPTAQTGATATAGGTADAVPPPNATNTGQIVPGLWRGTATVASGNSSTLLGVPIGWPRNVDGAVGAAINYLASTTSLDNFRPDTNLQLDKRLLTDAGYATYHNAPDTWGKVKQIFNLDDEGRPLGPDGKPAPERRLYAAGYTRYAVYQVSAASQDLSMVNVKVAMPTVVGVGIGDDLSSLRLRWTTVAVTMKWTGDDWRIEVMDREPLREPDVRQTNLPYSKIRELVGPGWLMPADATDQPYAGVVLAR